MAVPVQQVHCASDPVTPLAAAQALATRLPQARPIVVLSASCHVPTPVDYDAAR